MGGVKRETLEKNRGRVRENTLAPEGYKFASMQHKVASGTSRLVLSPTFLFLASVLASFRPFAGPSPFCFSLPALKLSLTTRNYKYLIKRVHDFRLFKSRFSAMHTYMCTHIKELPDTDSTHSAYRSSLGLYSKP